VTVTDDRPRSIWLRPERTGRGPVPEHDRSRITAAAIAIADADGLGAVSMRKIASALGTAPASLYRYVDSRDELLELMADAVAGDLDLSRPPSGDWRADLVALAHQLRDAYHRHPWLLDLVPGRVGVGPRAVDQLEYALAALAGLEVAGPVKLEAVAMLNGIVALAVRTELTVGASAAWSAAQADFLGAVVAAGDHPHLAAALAETSPTPEADVLDRILPRMLAGLLEA
jgi:AcrR family transcriptional regulator